MFTTAPWLRPYWAEKLLVTIWYSCTASWLSTKNEGPPIDRSLLSVPSMVKLLARARLPFTDSVVPSLLTLPKPGTTPGASSASVSIPLPAALVGRSCTLRFSKVAETCEVSVWIVVSVSAVTVTFAVAVPTTMSTLRLVISPSLTSTPVTVLALKPEIPATETVYLPGRRSGIKYRPSSPVTVLFSAPVASFLAATLAPATAWPLGSTTAPLRLPVVAWPIAGDENTKTSVTRNSETDTNVSHCLIGGKLLMFCPPTKLFVAIYGIRKKIALLYKCRKNLL